jgi:heme/copper-type cytochrome/quinol oxidase subunit 2
LFLIQDILLLIISLSIVFVVVYAVMAYERSLVSQRRGSKIKHN